MKNSHHPLWLKAAKAVLLGAFSMATLPQAFANDVAATTTAATAAISVWSQCAAENNITLPAKDSGIE